MRIIKSVRSDYRSILQAKIYIFLTRSMWVYLVCMLVIASVVPLPSVNMLLSGMIYFLSFLILVIIPTYHISTVRLANSLRFDADAEFSETEIVLRHRNKDVVETKDWGWIARIMFTQGVVVLETTQYPGFLILLSKKGMSDEEVFFFNRMRGKVRQK